MKYEHRTEGAEMRIKHIGRMGKIFVDILQELKLKEGSKCAH